MIIAPKLVDLISYRMSCRGILIRINDESSAPMACVYHAWKPLKRHRISPTSKSTHPFSLLSLKGTSHSDAFERHVRICMSVASATNGRSLLSPDARSRESPDWSNAGLSSSLVSPMMYRRLLPSVIINGDQCPSTPEFSPRARHHYSYPSAQVEGSLQIPGTSCPELVAWNSVTIPHFGIA